MSGKIEQYIKDATLYINKQAFEHINDEILRYDIDAVTIGSDIIVDAMRFEFIKNILDKYQNVVYVCNRHVGEYVEILLDIYNSRVVFVDEVDLVYAAKVDIFIHFHADYKIDALAKKGACFLAAGPFDFIQYSTKEVFENIFAEKSPFVFEVLYEYFGKKKLEKPIDIMYLLYGDVLSEEDIGCIYNSEAEYVSQYLLYLEFGIKNKAFRDRFKEITLIQSIYTHKNNLDNDEKLSDFTQKLVSFAKAIGR